MQKFEINYAKLVQRILTQGEVRETRNGETKSIFGAMLKVPMNGDMTFPILQGRRMYHKGVFGELATDIAGEVDWKDLLGQGGDGDTVNS